MNLIFPIRDIKVNPKRVKDLKITSVEMLYDRISIFQVRGSISFDISEALKELELAQIEFQVPNNIKVVDPIHREVKINKYVKFIISYRRNILTRTTIIAIRIMPIKYDENTYGNIKYIDCTFKTEFDMHTIVD